MRLLLDTHVFLWFVFADTGLNGYARGLIEDPANTKFVSVASLWDPFDRLIIAQGMAEGMAIVSADRAFDDYGVSRLW